MIWYFLQYIEGLRVSVWNTFGPSIMSSLFTISVYYMYAVRRTVGCTIGRTCQPESVTGGGKHKERAVRLSRHFSCGAAWIYGEKVLFLPRHLNKSAEFPSVLPYRG